MSRKTTLVGATVLLTLVTVAALVLYQKLGAAWSVFGHDVSIWIPGAILILIVIGGLQFVFGLWDTDDVTPRWVLVSVVIYTVLSLVFGIVFTEPYEGREYPVSRQNYTYEYSHSRTGGFYYLYFANSNAGAVTSSGSSTHVSVPASKGMGYAVMVGCFIALLFGSALIPHFWAIGTILGLVILGLFALKEHWREVEGYSRDYWGKYQSSRRKSGW